MSRIFVSLILAVAFLVAVNTQAGLVVYHSTGNDADMGDTLDALTFTLWTEQGNTGNKREIFANGATVDGSTVRVDVSGGYVLTGFSVTGYSYSGLGENGPTGLTEDDMILQSYLLNDSWAPKGNNGSAGTIGGLHITNVGPNGTHNWTAGVTTLNYTFDGVDEDWLQGGVLDFNNLFTGITNANGAWTFTFFGYAVDAGGGDPPVDVPEPATLALMGLGLAGLGLARRRRK